MSDLPKTQLPLTRCVRGYQDEPGAPVILPTACRLHCPIVRGKKVRETWLNAQDCADRLGYRSASTFPGAWRRGRIFRNVLRREGVQHRASGFPLCGLLPRFCAKFDTSTLCPYVEFCAKFRASIQILEQPFQTAEHFRSQGVGTLQGHLL